MVTFAQAQERAEEWINGDVPSYQHREVRVREFDLGFVVWAEDRADGPRSDGGTQRLVIARDSGEATLWPSLPVGEVIRRYEEEYGGQADAVSDAPPAPPARVDLNQTSFLLTPPEWLQEAADRIGIPDRREAETSGAGGASGGASGAGASSTSSARASSAGVSSGASSGVGSSGATPWPAAAGADDAAPGAPAGATPWAGTDTNGAGGEDRSVPLPETVYAPQLSDGDAGPGAGGGPSFGSGSSGSGSGGTPPEAPTALMSGGSQLPPTAVAPAVPGGPGVPGAPGRPGQTPPGAPGPGQTPPATPPSPPAPHAPAPPAPTPPAPERPLAPNAGDIADAATSKAAPPPRRGAGVAPPPPPGAPGAPGARAGGATPPPPSPPGVPGGAGGTGGAYVPTQMVSSLGPDGPGTPPPGTPGAPNPPGPPAPPTPPGPPGPPGAPGGAGGAGTPPGGVHHAATMLADPGPGGMAGPGAPGAPAAPGAPGAPGGSAGGAHGAVHHAETMLSAPPVGGPGAPPPPPPPPPQPMPPGPPGAPAPGGPPPAYGYPQQPTGQPTVGPGYQAVLRYRAQDGSEQQLIRRSAPGTPHPEWQIFHELRAMNVPPDQVLELHTELESCELPGAYCARMIREQWPQARITSIAPYGTDQASRQQGMRQLLSHQGELHQVADGPARPAPVRAPLPPVQPAPPVPPEGVAQELAAAFGPGVFRFEQAAVSRQGVPPVVAHTLMVAGLPVDMGPFFWAQAQPGRPVPTLAELAAERGVQPASDAGSYLVMGSDFGKAICVQYGTAHIVAVPVEAGPGGAPVPPQFVNTGLPEFTRCLALLGRMWRLRFGLNQEQAGRWTVDFQAQLAALDPAALGSPESWWSVLLEQMWDGLL
ncbi:SUKH-4 family immunity protein [Streptomyces sp. B93]|uniref:SUKH-4 family immunity protein n=1 Tax=Streptomyces sp. B93 TaxID=2824875 RepID=UPI001B363573|nr:SUKH-4 family immunity protein [Streptomyces sp. B93]MBQ1089550.1 SUKH-4 family immunity protein [Streptomyces sp. B93]